MNKYFLISLVLLFFSCSKKENEKDASVKVWGNCGMCKQTIEKSLDHPAVYTKEWSPETKKLSVSFDSTKISLAEIHKKIATSGYDTEQSYADEEAYKNLHSCCQYKRRK
jgi:mercuric ion binding protein